MKTEEERRRQKKTSKNIWIRFVYTSLFVFKIRSNYVGYIRLLIFLPEFGSFVAFIACVFCFCYLWLVIIFTKKRTFWPTKKCFHEKNIRIIIVSPPQGSFYHYLHTVKNKFTNLKPNNFHYIANGPVCLTWEVYNVFRFVMLTCLSSKRMFHIQLRIYYSSGGGGGDNGLPKYKYATFVHSF